MSETVIRVEHLGKQYRIGALQGKGGRYGYKSLRDSIARSVSLPLRAIRSMARRGGNPRSDPNEAFWALNDVSFEVKRGQVLGLVGRNGAGKSTLLKVLARITEPTVGSATIRGRVGSLLEVGTGFHPELTGRENVFLNGAVLGMARSEIQRQFDAIVSFAEVERFIDTPVKRYSSGMYLRLAFAVAAHLETEILLIDEVLAVGDIVFQKKCLQKIEGVAKHGRTVLFVSHSMNSIEQLCSRALMLSAGGIVADGAPAEVVSQYIGPSDPESGKPIWINSGNEYDSLHFKPMRFYLADGAGRQLPAQISANTDVWVTVEGRIETIDPAMLVGYAAFARNGQLLFWSYNRDEAESYWQPLGTGYCRLRSRIPARLLNQGSYRLELAVNFYCREWISRPGKNSPAIHFEIAGGASDSPYWYTYGRDGFLAPIFHWEVVQKEQTWASESQSRHRGLGT